MTDDIDLIRELERSHALTVALAIRIRAIADMDDTAAMRVALMRLIEGFERG